MKNPMKKINIINKDKLKQKGDILLRKLRKIDQKSRIINSSLLNTDKSIQPKNLLSIKISQKGRKDIMKYASKNNLCINGLTELIITTQIKNKDLLYVKQFDSTQLK